MRLLGLLGLFVLVPFVELYLIFEVVGGELGAPLTILLLAVDSVLGAVLLRTQGRAVWGRFSRAVAERRMPHEEVVEGVLVIFGGAFLITPGFLTDIVGLLFLLPPTRRVARRAIMRRIAVRIGARPATAPAPRAPGDVVEGTAAEYEAPAPRLER